MSNDFTETSLLAAIKGDPADDLPRLAYADWLEERGDDDRATHIRAQLEMAKLPEGSPRHNALQRISSRLEVRHPEWSAALKKLNCTQIAFGRGFLHEVTIQPAVFLAHAKALSAVPNLGITIHAPDTSVNCLTALAESPFIDKFRRVDLAADSVSAADVIHLAGLTGSQNLTGLRLRHDAIQTQGIYAIATSRNLTNLTSLHLEDNHLGPYSAGTLAGSPNVARLRILKLPFNELTPEGGLALACSRHLGNLTTLDLNTTHINNEVMEALASPACVIKNLRSLKLRTNPVTERGIEALAQSPNFRHLTDLDLSNPQWPRSLASLVALAQSPHLGNLRRLNLQFYGNLSGAGLQPLADSPYLKNIHALNLTSCSIDDEAVETPAKSANFSSLTNLEISYNSLSDKGALALAQSPHMAHLESLDITHNYVSDKGAMALVKQLPNLLDLKIHRNQIGSQTENEINRILNSRRQERTR